MGPNSRAAALAAGTLLLAGSLAGCTSSTKPAVGATASVSRATISTGVNSTGSLSATKSQDLGFAKGGQLTKVKVKVGDLVHEGDVLAKIDDYSLKQVLSQQKANLAQQEAILGRIGTNPGVEGAGATLSQARQIVGATQRQVAATQRADSSAINRAHDQLDFDQRQEDKTERALHQAQDNCVAPPCADIAAAEQAHAATKLRVETDQTALTAAEQKKKVDAATGQVQIETATQAVVTAQNNLASSSSDKPFNIEQQRALVNSAGALVRNARNDVHDATLVAPFDGVISAVNGRVGEFLTPSSGTTALAPGSDAAIPGTDSTGAAGGTGGGATPTRPGGSQFLVISGATKLQVVLPFEESDAAQIKPDQKITVTFDAVPDLVSEGTVVSVAPSATAISGTINYYVTAKLDRVDKRLKAGQTARATVVTNHADNALSVPTAAVHHQGNETTVTVVDGGQQRTVAFEAGIVAPDLTEVRSGLTEGTQILLPAGTN